MSEITGEMETRSVKEKQTLPGLGPRVGVERLRCDAAQMQHDPLTDEEMQVIDLMRAQVDRYEWFAERIMRRPGVEQFAAVLLRSPAGPGLWEEALVALSLSDDETAHNLLEQWQPPVEDPEMRLFYQVCVSRSRRRRLR